MFKILSKKDYDALIGEIQRLRAELAAVSEQNKVLEEKIHDLKVILGSMKLQNAEAGFEKNETNKHN